MIGHIVEGFCGWTLISGLVAVGLGKLIHKSDAAPVAEVEVPAGLATRPPVADNTKRVGDDGDGYEVQS